MMKLILIDDEPKALKNLHWELERYCEDIEIVGMFESGHAAKKFLTENHVDCIFLDVELPDMDGFHLLEQFPDRKFSVIITTAFNQYAIQAIKEMALDYLLKPINREELVQSVEKARQFKNRANLNGSTKPPKPLETVFDFQKKISIPFEGKIIFLPPGNINYCEGDGNYCYIYLDNGEKIFITQKLKFMEEKLKEYRFFRIHNSFLVNLNKITEYHKHEDFVILSGQLKLPVSRLKKTLFLEQF